MANALRRTLLTVDDSRCPFGCVYCFADFSSYSGTTTLSEVEQNPALIANVDIIYPACDIDFFARPDTERLLKRLTALKRSVSISTKAQLRPKHIVAAKSAASALRAHGCVLKISVSASTSSRTADFEPRTATFPRRVENMIALKEAGIPTSLLLKPILPIIPFEEYESMITDVAAISRALVIGDLWQETPEYIGAAVEPVEWLQDHPSWRRVRDVEKTNRITVRARELGMRVYHSDLDFMTDLIRELGTALRTESA